MRRNLMFLFALIFTVLVGSLTGCSNSSHDSSSKTREPSVILAESRQLSDGFKVDFPTTAGLGLKPVKSVDPADELLPKHTSYMTEVHPGKETELYVVMVFEDDLRGKNIQKLLAQYTYDGWRCVQKNKIALETCTLHETVSPAVTVEMLVATKDKLFIVQAGTMSDRSPTYANDFLDSFKPI